MIEEIEKYSPKWLLNNIYDNDNAAQCLLHIIEFQNELMKESEHLKKGKNKLQNKYDGLLKLNGKLNEPYKRENENLLKENEELKEITEVCCKPAMEQCLKYEKEIVELKEIVGELESKKCERCSKMVEAIKRNS